MVDKKNEENILDLQNHKHFTNVDWDSVRGAIDLS